MAQIEVDELLSLSLFGQRLGRMQKGSAFQQLPSLRHSCRRSGRSPALPYLPHEFSHSITPVYPLDQRGHLYFGKQGTFLFWVDRSLV
jgi:hypothetical protein